jgi:D-serine deaminase-like pyridoxal phosphate-dependent protein
MYDEEQVAALRCWPIEASEKGFGGLAHQSPVTAGQLARERPRADAGLLSTPRVLLREEALRHNISAMAAYCAAHDVSLFPHGKTTMAPQVLAAQLDAGAGGITAASISQVRLLRRFGVRNVLLANEVVDDASISWLARELTTAGGQFSFLCYVDSVTGAGRLDAMLAACGFAQRLRVLVELGHEDGRTGCRTSAEAIAVAAAVARSPRLELAGVAGYEGSLMAPTPGETARKARAYCGELGQLALSLAASGQFPEPPVVTAGGSAYFDVVVDVLGRRRDWKLILRSGCYVTHDHGLYSRITPSARRTPGVPILEPALEAWAPVLSRPEPETAVLGIGRRDVSFDAGHPVVLRGRAAGGTDLDPGGSVVRRLFDQHTVLSVPAGSRLAPGDELCLGISHPCTTFDKWRWIPVLDAEDRITDVIRTFF